MSQATDTQLTLSEYFLLNVAARLTGSTAARLLKEQGLTGAVAGIATGFSGVLQTGDLQPILRAFDGAFHDELQRFRKEADEETKRAVESARRAWEERPGSFMVFLAGCIIGCLVGVVIGTLLG